MAQRDRLEAAIREAVRLLTRALDEPKRPPKTARDDAGAIIRLLAPEEVMTAEEMQHELGIPTGPASKRFNKRIQRMSELKKHSKDKSGKTLTRGTRYHLDTWRCEECHAELARILQASRQPDAVGGQSYAVRLDEEVGSRRKVTRQGRARRK